MLGPFPLPFTYGGLSTPKTVLELRLAALSAAIRAKRDWQTKRRDPVIVEKWRQEANIQHISADQFQYVIDELNYYEKLCSDAIEVADVDGVWKSSSLLPDKLRTEFANHVASLANVPEREKDWHPGSEQKVLDLVHPGLYLFVSGETRTVQPDKSPTTQAIPTKLPDVIPRNSNFTSATYQWIPTPISVDHEGKCNFLSYINNLHPKKHDGLYHTLAEMFSYILPMFEHVLGFLAGGLAPKIDLSMYEIWNESNEPQQAKDEDDLTFDERWSHWYEHGRTMNPLPKITFNEPPQVTPVDLRARTLQVIVKIQEIHLTPEKPTYDGGVWHVEGMQNENIVASAIYYYSSDNITECNLSFRQAVDDPEYEQNDNQGVEALYGLQDGEPLVQNMGSVVTKVKPRVAG